MCDRVNEGLIPLQSQNEFLSYEPNKNNIMMSQKSGFWQIMEISNFNISILLRRYPEVGQLSICLWGSKQRKVRVNYVLCGLDTNLHRNLEVEGGSREERELNEAPSSRYSREAPLSRLHRIKCSLFVLRRAPWAKHRLLASGRCRIKCSLFWDLIAVNLKWISPAPSVQFFAMPQAELCLFL